jgi:hypothetical protein
MVYRGQIDISNALTRGTEKLDRIPGETQGRLGKSGEDKTFCSPTGMKALIYHVTV